MRRFAGRPSRAALRPLIDHDDPDRGFEYSSGAEATRRVAPAEGWTVVSVRQDWTRAFADWAGIPEPEAPRQHLRRPSSG